MGRKLSSVKTGYLCKGTTRYIDTCKLVATIYSRGNKKVGIYHQKHSFVFLEVWFFDTKTLYKDPRSTQSLRGGQSLFKSYCFVLI